MPLRSRFPFYFLTLFAGLLVFLGVYRCAFGLVSICSTQSGGEIKPESEAETLDQDSSFSPLPSAPFSSTSEVSAASPDLEYLADGRRDNKEDRVLPQSAEQKVAVELKPAVWQTAFDLPPSAPLASEIEISAALPDLEQLAVGQHDDKGNRVELETIKFIKVGSFSTARIVPQLLGNVEVTLWSTFKDGTNSRQDFSMTVMKPVSEPLEFRADYNNFHEIILGVVGDTYEFIPIAVYAVTGAASFDSEVEVQVNGHVRYRHTDASDTSVVRLEEDGTLTALRPGMSEIEARYGSSVDVVSVIVGLNY